MEGKKISSFRERFNELIDSSSKSRNVIAEEFGVAKQTISAWSTGKSSPRLPAASALADYFGVNLGWLLGFDVPKYIDKSKLASYESYMREMIENTNRIGLVTQSELYLVDSFRSLSSRGQELLIERANELKVLYARQADSDQI